MQKKIIVEYDYVRAITTILVILGHCTYYSIKTDYGGIDLGIEDSCFTGKALTVLTATIYSFHMPLFIALSGCLWAIKISKPLSFKDLLSSKSRRLLKPFLFTALFLSIPLKFISGYWGGGIWQRHTFRYNSRTVAVCRKCELPPMVFAGIVPDFHNCIFH